MSNWPTTELLQTEAQLRELLGEPADLVKAKVVDRIVGSARPFIEMSPLVWLATSDSQGHCDVSPRGDQPGFVQILDDKTVLIPERPGNRLADSLRNILVNPQIGLYFMIPGVPDGYRINGQAVLTTDAQLLNRCEAFGKLPKLAILVRVESAYTHCAKAFMRGDIWNSERFVTRASLPTNGTIMREVCGESLDADGYDRERAERYARREGFY